MAKQVVTENWSNGSVEITLSYGFDSDLIGKKQFEELTIPTENGKIVKHWVRVPDNVSAGESIKNTRKADKIAAKKLAKQKYWADRREKINERILKYRSIVESGGVLFGCDRDDCFGF